MIRLISFLVLILIGACCTPAGTGLNADALVGTRWLLEDLGGKGVLDRVQTTVQFQDENRIAGSGGCNNYFGTFQVENNEFSVGPIGATRKMCPPAVMDQEDRFFRALEKAQRITLEGPYLLIDCEGLDKPLKFSPNE